MAVLPAARFHRPSRFCCGEGAALSSQVRNGSRSGYWSPTARAMPSTPVSLDYSRAARTGSARFEKFSRLRAQARSFGDARQRQHLYTRSTTPPEDLRYFVDGRSGCLDIVDYQHRAGQLPPDFESSANIDSALVLRQSRLSRGRPPPSEHLTIHRSSQCCREQLRLVVPAFTQAGSMERHGNDQLGDEVLTVEACPERGSERSRKRDPIVVLEVVDRETEGFVEDECSPSEVVTCVTGAAPTTQPVNSRGLVTAPRTHPTLNGFEPGSTRPAEHPELPLLRRLPAQHAVHREEQVQNRINQWKWGKGKGTDEYITCSRTVRHKVKWEVSTRRHEGHEV